MFFNPGLAPENLGWEYVYTPSALPFSSDAAGRLRRRFKQLGQNVGREDLKALAVDVVTDQAPVLRQEMADLEAFTQGRAFQDLKADTELERERANAARQSQLLLLLGFDLEEQLIELSALRARYNISLDRFSESLGSSLEDAQGAPPLALEDAGKVFPVIPWRQTLGHMVRLLDRPFVLFTGESDLYNHWRAAGIDFKPLDESLRRELHLPPRWAEGQGLEAAGAALGDLLADGRSPSAGDKASNKYCRLLYRPPGHME